jgi:hypothetical protein
MGRIAAAEAAQPISLYPVGLAQTCHPVATAVLT